MFSFCQQLISKVPLPRSECYTVSLLTTSNYNMFLGESRTSEVVLYSFSSHLKTIGWRMLNALIKAKNRSSNIHVNRDFPILCNHFRSEVLLNLFTIPSDCGCNEVTVFQPFKIQHIF